jgi:hypothetical protein
MCLFSGTDYGVTIDDILRGQWKVIGAFFFASEMFCWIFFS